MIRIISVVIATAIAASAQSINPRVFLLDAKQKPPLAKLETEARKALTAGPFSVTTKEVVPPSGDKHDYMSQAPYWWPDPKSTNGLPYIRRDGERNRGSEKITDQRVKDQTVGAVDDRAPRASTT